MYVLENNEHHFTKLFVAKLDMKRVFNIFSIKKQIYSYLYNRFWYKLFHESLLDYIFIACLPICRRDTAIRLCSYLTRNGKKFWHLPALYICKRIRTASIICFPLLRFFRLLHREDISSQLCNL